MSETLAPKRALILWCLLGRQGSALQSEIVPRVERADREALVAGRYLSVERQGRSLRLTVEDKGWNWAGAHLRDPLPPTFRVLSDWLARLDAHLSATGETLAGLVSTPRASPEPPAAEKPKPLRKPRGSSGGNKPGKRLGAAKLRARIEDAYLALTGGEKAKAVRLSALRHHLADLDRGTVDAGLAAILRSDKTARLSQFSDPRSLDAAEREAAFSPAGEPFHIIWIEP